MVYVCAYMFSSCADTPVFNTHGKPPVAQTHPPFAVGDRALGDCSGAVRGASVRGLRCAWATAPLGIVAGPCAVLLCAGCAVRARPRGLQRGRARCFCVWAAPGVGNNESSRCAVLAHDTFITATAAPLLLSVPGKNARLIYVLD